MVSVMTLPCGMADIPELRSLNVCSLALMGMFAEEFVNDEGELESPDMDPFAEDDEEAFERFFDSESDVGDAGLLAVLDDFEDDLVGFDDAADEVQPVVVAELDVGENARLHGESGDYSQVTVDESGEDSISVDHHLDFVASTSDASAPTNGLYAMAHTFTTEIVGVK